MHAAMGVVEASAAPDTQLGQRQAQVLLEYLAHRVPGERVHDCQLLGALLDGQTFEAAVVTDIAQLHFASRSRNHYRHDPFSRA